MQKIFNGEDKVKVMVYVHKSGETKPVFSGITDLVVGSVLTVDFNVQMHVSPEAYYGCVGEYKVEIKPLMKRRK